VTVTAEDSEHKDQVVPLVFSLKTDTGAVWVSVDGKKWKRQ
jgi:hypothetical protein